MSEDKMRDAVQEALGREGVTDEVIAAGQFNPRGHTGAMFAGGLAGDELGGTLGTAAGSIAGPAASDEASGLPQSMLVGVTATHVYGFAGRSRSEVPEKLAFQTEREGLEAKVHKRVNVRVLELIHPDSGSKIELEGNRLPVTHSKDVIDELASGG
jgi:hypothetical protein